MDLIIALSETIVILFKVSGTVMGPVFVATGINALWCSSSICCLARERTTLRRGFCLPERGEEMSDSVFVVLLLLSLWLSTFLKPSGGTR